MATNIEYLHADQIGGCVTLISTETTKICIDFLNCNKKLHTF